MCMAHNMSRPFWEDFCWIMDARTLLDMVLESRRVHLMYLLHGTVPFGFLTILYFRRFDLLSGKK